MPNQIDRKHSPWKSFVWGLATVTVGAEASDTITVTVQLKNDRGANIAQAVHLEGYLSDDSIGASLAASAPTGGWAQVSGTLETITTNKRARFRCTAAGVFSFTISESSAKTFYFVLECPDGSNITTPITFV
jgi:hypothetical protein